MYWRDLGAFDMLVLKIIAHHTGTLHVPRLAHSFKGQCRGSRTAAYVRCAAGGLCMRTFCSRPVPFLPGNDSGRIVTMDTVRRIVRPDMRDPISGEPLTEADIIPLRGVRRPRARLPLGMKPSITQPAPPLSRLPQGLLGQGKISSPSGLHHPSQRPRSACCPINSNSCPSAYSCANHCCMRALKDIARKERLGLCDT